MADIDKQAHPKDANSNESKMMEAAAAAGGGEGGGGEKSCWPSSSVSSDGTDDAVFENIESASLKSALYTTAGGKDEEKTDALNSGGIWGRKDEVSRSTDLWSATSQGLDWKKDDQSLSSMLQGIAGEGMSSMMSREGNQNYPWGSGPDGPTKTSDSLGLSDVWKPNMFGSSVGFGGGSGGGGSGCWGAVEDPRINNWGLSDIKNEFSSEGEKKVGGEGGSKGLWGSEERKVEPIGAGQKRSSSLTELNITFETSSKFSSSLGKAGSNDERSQPDGAEVQQQNKEELIAKLVNSNEGWGKKPISQETPWHMDQTLIAPPVSESPSQMTEESGTAKNDGGVFWQAPKETNAPYWNNNTPSSNNNNSSSNNTAMEWAPDSDIGVWNGPPPPESINPNMWTGPPKDVGGVPWLGQGRMVPGGVDKGLLPPGGVAWTDSGYAGFDKLPKDVGGVSHGAPDNWMQPPMRGSSESSWMSPDMAPNAWGSSQSNDQLQMLKGNYLQAAGALGKSFGDQVPKIGNWGDSASSFGDISNSSIGPWNQQQKDEAIFRNNAGVDKLMEMISGSRSQRDSDLSKGRMIRGKSMVEMPNNDGNHFGQYHSGGRNIGGGGGGFQMSRGSAFQPPGMAMSQMKQQQPPPMGGWGNPLHGTRTPSMGMGGGGGGGSGGSSMVPSMSQMNPQMLQSLLSLQTLLQPLLLKRSQVQQDRNQTQAQKQMQVDQLNIHIQDIKQRIDQVQMSFGPPQGLLPPPDLQMGGAGGMDEFKMMQLLGQLKLDQQPLLGGGGGGMGSDSMLMNDGRLAGLSMDQMAALINSNRWQNTDGGGGVLPSHNAVQKDKYGMSNSDSFDWAGLAGGPGSKMGLPPSGVDFLGGGKGNRPPPPPGLGTGHKAGDDIWNQHSMSRSTSWAPGEKFKSNFSGLMFGASSNWLMLKNIPPMTDPTMLQALCLKYGLLQNFYYNKSGQVLACYMNREDIVNALNNLSQFPIGSSRLAASVVSTDDIGRLIDNTWIAIPLFNTAPPMGKSNPFTGGHGGSGGWGMEGM